jgi:NitT/TauT family transport system substrate-binding protein
MRAREETMTEGAKIRATRREVIAGGVAIVAFPMPALAQAPIELSVGIVNASSDIEVFLAQKKGWFRDEGISVKTIAFRSAADMVAPLATGQLDVGGGSVSAGLYNSFARGIKLRVVADKASSQPGYGVNKCVVAKRHVESGRFKTLADLKGMKVAMNGPGNSGWGSLWGVLKLAGLTLNDVETVDLTYPNHVVALQNNSVDAGITTEPSATLSILRGYAVEATTDDKTRPKHAIAQILYSEKISGNPDLAKRFMRAYLRSVRYYFGALKDGHLAGPNAEEIISTLTEFTAIKDPQVYRTITPNGVDPDGRIDIPSLKEDQEVYKMRGWIQSDTKVEQVIDMSFVEAAVKELGPYKRG